MMFYKQETTLKVITIFYSKSYQELYFTKIYIFFSIKFKLEFFVKIFTNLQKYFIFFFFHSNILPIILIYIRNNKINHELILF
jgi:hypothetical protein